MANEISRLKDKIVILVSAAPNQRVRPHEMERDLAHELGISIFAVQEAVRTLTEEGRLVFTYRDPWSYLEGRNRPNRLGLLPSRGRPST